MGGGAFYCSYQDKVHCKSQENNISLFFNIIPNLCSFTRGRKTYVISVTSAVVVELSCFCLSSIFTFLFFHNINHVFWWLSRVWLHILFPGTAKNIWARHGFTLTYLDPLMWAFHMIMSCEVIDGHNDPAIDIIYRIFYKSLSKIHMSIWVPQTLIFLYHNERTKLYNQVSLKENWLITELLGRSSKSI